MKNYLRRFIWWINKFRQKTNIYRFTVCVGFTDIIFAIFRNLWNLVGYYIHNNYWINYVNSAVINDVNVAAYNNYCIYDF